MGQFLAARFAQPQPVDAEGPAKQESTWWCRLLAKVAGTLAGVVGVICGILRCISVSALCIISGLLLLIGAVVVLVFEVPICFSFADLTKPIAVFAEKRTFFQRAIIYVIIAIIPLMMCFSPSTVIGCGLIFAAGVVYGLMGLGRKADRQQMMATAVATDRPLDRAKPDDTQVGLIDNEDQLRMDMGTAAAFGGAAIGQRQQFP